MAKKTEKTENNLVHLTTEDLKKYQTMLTQIGDGKVGMDILHLLKSRYKLLYITTNEERRVYDCISLISVVGSYNLYTWDMSRGMINCNTDPPKQVDGSNNEIHSLLPAALGYVIEHATKDAEIEKANRIGEGSIYVFFDLHQHFDPLIERKLKEFSSISSALTIIIVAPTYNCPIGLESDVTLIDFPYPSRSEFRRSLKLLVKDSISDFPNASVVANNREEDILNSVAGLTLTESENAMARSLITQGTFDIQVLLGEKHQMIKKTGVLECRNPRYTMDDVGGLENAKEWIRCRRTAFSQEAIDFGIDAPRGFLLIGCPGCGKSLLSEATASFYELPLLRLDIASLFSSYVGQSEQNLRRAIKIIESVAPCVLHVDEIEKAIGGVQSSNNTDGGVTARIFGTLLTWMQDKTASVFVAATANKIADIPPEFMRAGRFDEIFFVDLPNSEQRYDVTERLILRKKRKPEDFNIASIVNKSENYSPAEIEKAINNGLFVAFSEKRELQTDDIVSALSKFKPLYDTRREEIEEMREWATQRAVLANSSHKKTNKVVANKMKGVAALLTKDF